MTKSIKRKSTAQESEAPNAASQKLRKDLLKMILRNEQKRNAARTAKKATG